LTVTFADPPFRYGTAALSSWMPLPCTAPTNVAHAVSPALSTPTTLIVAEPSESVVKLIPALHPPREGYTTVPLLPCWLQSSWSLALGDIEYDCAFSVRR
jgi:hypothetical protein